MEKKKKKETPIDLKKKKKIVSIYWINFSALTVGVIFLFFFFYKLCKKKIRYRVNRNVNFHPKILVSDPSRMDAFFKFSRGGLDERRETKNLRGVYPRQIYYPDDPIYNDAQQDSRLTPTLFHRQRQKRTAVIFLFEKRVHPHRN